MSIIKCEARIIKEYKRDKADVLWPQIRPTGLFWQPNPEIKELPICGGDVTLIIRAGYEPYYGGVNSVLEIEETCTRCKHPFHKWTKFICDWSSKNEINLNHLLEEYEC